MDLEHYLEDIRRFRMRCKEREVQLQEKYDLARRRCMAISPLCEHRYANQGRIKINTNYKPPAPANYSYSTISRLEDSSIPIRGIWNKAWPEPPRDANTGRYLTETVWLDHNKLQSLNMLVFFLEARIESPFNITWLDLSFNQISRIEWDLLQLKGIEILYMHCNCLDALEEIAKLSGLPNLKILTMYGNPIEASDDYRLKVIAQFPKLRRLDFSPVSDKERFWAGNYKLLKLEDETSIVEEKKVQEIKDEEEKDEVIIESKDEANDDLKDTGEEGEQSTEEVHLEEESSGYDEVSTSEMDTSEDKRSEALPREFEEPRVFIKPTDSSWWTEDEQKRAEELYWELKEEQKHYVFDYFVS